MEQGTARMTWIYGSMTSPWIYELGKCIGMDRLEESIFVSILGFLDFIQL